MASNLPRLAIINPDRCKPKKCKRECKTFCPLNQNEQMCIEVSKTSKIALISETLCVGCAQCVKKCPFKAVQIIRIPFNLEKETTHRYGPNTFKLHRLPIPRPHQVLGLVGNNGIGKSTALKILSATIKPNLGRFDDAPTWKEILTYFRGSELQAYFQRILGEEFKVTVKPQHVTTIRDALLKGRGSSKSKTVKSKPPTVKSVLQSIILKRISEDQELKSTPLDIDGQKKLAKKYMKDISIKLSLVDIAKRRLPALSGGELQRFSIALIVCQKADVYMFDEPTSWLDVKQRVKASQVIRGIVTPETFLIVVEHDLAILDYLSDFVCVLHGTPGAYGVVTKPFSVRDGINIFLAGFIPTENLRFRSYGLSFQLVQTADGEDLAEDGSNKVDSSSSTTTSSSSKKKPSKQASDEDDDDSPTFGGVVTWPSLTKTFTDKKGNQIFKLHVDAGTFSKRDIIVMLGENGTGKTTMIKMLAGKSPADNDISFPELGFSYKPQTIDPKFDGTVRELLFKKIRSSFSQPQFQTIVVKPLNIQVLLDLQVKKLSGGERQRVAICLALGLEASVYLLDEPSCFLSAEQRITVSKVIRRFILHSGRTAFVVEHDMIMASYLASKIIVFSGTPSVECKATTPQSLLTGMNTFLKSLDITFRRDPENYRPRINKQDSQMDQVQKKNGQFFYTEVSE